MILLFDFSSNIFAATPKLVSKIESAFNNIESWILKLSTPAAAGVDSFKIQLSILLKALSNFETNFGVAAKTFDSKFNKRITLKKILKNIKKIFFFKKSPHLLFKKYGNIFNFLGLIILFPSDKNASAVNVCNFCVKKFVS